MSELSLGPLISETRGRVHQKTSFYSFAHSWSGLQACSQMLSCRFVCILRNQHAVWLCNVILQGREANFLTFSSNCSTSTELALSTCPVDAWNFLRFSLLRASSGVMFPPPSWRCPPPSWRCPPPSCVWNVSQLIELICVQLMLCLCVLVAEASGPLAGPTSFGFSAFGRLFI